jgi:hypothetical protein
MRFIFTAFIFIFALSNTANAFCGFYVAKADGKLFNKASKVVYVRDGNKPVITMSSDYQALLKSVSVNFTAQPSLRKSQSQALSWNMHGTWHGVILAPQTHYHTNN